MGEAVALHTCPPRRFSLTMAPSLFRNVLGSGEEVNHRTKKQHPLPRHFLASTSELLSLFSTLVSFLILFFLPGLPIASPHRPANAYSSPFFSFPYRSGFCTSGASPPLRSRLATSLVLLHISRSFVSPRPFSIGACRVRRFLPLFPGRAVSLRGLITAGGDSIHCA